MEDQERIYHEFETWLKKISLMEYPDPEVTAYYLSLAESSQGILVNLRGSKLFTENDPEWVCNDDFIPQEMLRSHLLQGTNDANLPDIKSMVGVMMQRFLRNPVHENSFLNDAQVIAVGSDEGTPEIICRKS